LTDLKKTATNKALITHEQIAVIDYIAPTNYAHHN
jgi:hypothetical protein